MQTVVCKVFSKSAKHSNTLNLLSVFGLPVMLPSCKDGIGKVVTGGPTSGLTTGC